MWGLLKGTALLLGPLLVATFLLFGRRVARPLQPVANGTRAFPRPTTRIRLSTPPEAVSLVAIALGDGRSLGAGQYGELKAVRGAPQGLISAQFERWPLGNGTAFALLSRANGHFVRADHHRLVADRGIALDNSTESDAMHLCGDGSTCLLGAMNVTLVPIRRARAVMPPPAAYTILSLDYHIATARDSGTTLRSLGMRFEDHSLSGACRLTGTCAQGLRVISRESAFTLCPRPHSIRRRFHAAYKNDALITRADAFICSHPAALAELFLPFNRALLVVVTTNLELARENADRWAAWVETLRRIAADERAVVAANSLYDVAYVRHFTRVDPLYLPTLALYADAVYEPRRPEVLIAPAHGKAAEALLRRAQTLGAGAGVHLRWVRDLYPTYTLRDLALHPAVVCVPYTKSVMTFFELYRMGVPLFYPSLSVRGTKAPVATKPRGLDGACRWCVRPCTQFLVNLEMDRNVMSERIYWSRTPGGHGVDPNTRTNRTAVEHWLKLSDPYTYPHVQYFDSVEDLVGKLQTATQSGLQAVSRAMRAHADQLADDTRAAWAAALRRVVAANPPGSLPVPPDFDRELERRFGLRLPVAEPTCVRRSAPDQGKWS